MNSSIKTGQNCKVFCCVYGCTSKGSRNRELSFHLFPKRGARKVRVKKTNGTELIDAQKAWILALKMGKAPSAYMKVCSLHFNPTDFCVPNLNRKRRVLKVGTVPSCNLPTGVHEGQEVMAQKPIKKHFSKNLQAGDTECICQEQEIMEEPVSDIEAANILCSLRAEYRVNVDKKEVSVQVSSGDIQQNFINMLETDENLCSATAVRCFSHYTRLNYRIRSPNKHDLQKKVSKSCILDPRICS